MNKLLPLLFLLFNSSIFHLHTMQSTPDHIIWEGKQTYLVSLLNKIILNEEKTNPFSVTKIIRYDNGNFTEVGDIFDAQEQDFKMIYIDKNYLYTDFLIRTKTRLSKNDYQNVGAIIVGTQDPVNIDKARINQFSKIIFNTKLMKKKFNENK